MSRPSTWLPQQDSTGAPDDSAGRRARLRTKTPLWLRVVLVLAFAGVVLLGQLWALFPDLSDVQAMPGRVPSLLVLLAAALFLPVVFQVSSKVPLVVAGLALLWSVPAQWVLAVAVEDGYHNLAMHRSAGAQVVSATLLESGPSRVRLHLADGRTVDGLFTIPGRSEHWMIRRSYNPLQPGRYGPFAQVAVGSTHDVLVDPGGRSPVVDAAADDVTPAGRRRASLWLAAAAVAWLPLVGLALSALLRRRSYWDVPEDQLDAELR